MTATIDKAVSTHALISHAFLTQLEVGWDTLLAAKVPIEEHNRPPIVALNERLERLIMDIHRGPIPIDNLPLVAEQPAQFDANERAAFLAHLAASLSGEKGQLNRITFDHREGAQLSHQLTIQVLMHWQEVRQSRSNWQFYKQDVIVALEPAIKRMEMAPIEGKQDANRYHFDFDTSSLGYVPRRIMDTAKIWMGMSWVAMKTSLLSDRFFFYP